MRALVKAIKTSELDPNAGKARYAHSIAQGRVLTTFCSPDQLVLQDDPAFLPDLVFPGLDIDLSSLDISTNDSSRRSSILSPHSQRSSLSSHPEANESMLGLVIPTSDTGGAGDIGGFMLPAENVSSAQRSAQLRRLYDDEDEGFDLDPGFSFDADGNLIEERTPGSAVIPAQSVQLGSDFAVSAHERQEVVQSLQTERREVSLVPS